MKRFHTYKNQKAVDKRSCEPRLVWDIVAETLMDGTSVLAPLFDPEPGQPGSNSQKGGAA